MCSKMLLYYIMVKKTENKKEYYKNYILKNKDKLNAKRRVYYQANKDKLNAKRRDNYQAKKNNEINRMKKIDEDIEKLKEKFRLLYEDYEDVNINILIIVTR